MDRKKQNCLLRSCKRAAGVFGSVLLFAIGLLSGLFVSTSFALPFNDEMVNDQFKVSSFMRANPTDSVPTQSSSRFIADRETARTMLNPFKGNPEAELRGERLFRANCTVCHGVYTPTEGYEAGKIIAPLVGVDLSLPLMEPGAENPSVMVPKPDGHYFGYVYFGGLALMPRYGWKFSVDEHWEIVTYIQKMQRERAEAGEGNQEQPKGKGTGEG